MESLEGTPGVSEPVTIKQLLETPAWQVQPEKRSPRRAPLLDLGCFIPLDLMTFVAGTEE